MALDARALARRPARHRRRRRLTCTACGLPIDSTATSTDGVAARPPAATARSRLGSRGARPAASNGTRARSKIGAPMSTVTRPSSSRRSSITPDIVSHARARVLSRQALVAHEAHEAARAVAALLDLAAVAVEDAVAEIDARARRCGSTDQHLVGADAEAAVGQAPHLRRASSVERRARRVEHDEVVAGALHLGESAVSCARLSAARRVDRRDRIGDELHHTAGSPGGRVLKRLCTHRYCAGLARISSSIQRVHARACRRARRRSGSRPRRIEAHPLAAAPGRHLGDHRLTTMSSARAMREGASSVAAGMPKNGTKAASRSPKSMSGRLKKAAAAADRAQQRLAPHRCARRSRPG